MMKIQGKMAQLHEDVRGCFQSFQTGRLEQELQMVQQLYRYFVGGSN